MMSLLTAWNIIGVCLRRHPLEPRPALQASELQMQSVGHSARIGAATGTLHGLQHSCRRVAEEQRSPVSQQRPEGDYSVQNSKHLEVMNLRLPVLEARAEPSRNPKRTPPSGTALRVVNHDTKTARPVREGGVSVYHNLLSVHNIEVKLKRGEGPRSKRGTSAPCATGKEAMHPPTRVIPTPDHDEQRGKPRSWSQLSLKLQTKIPIATRGGQEEPVLHAETGAGDSGPSEARRESRLRDATSVRRK